jgi:hypothetical protein
MRKREQARRVEIGDNRWSGGSGVGYSSGGCSARNVTR